MSYIYRPVLGEMIQNPLPEGTRIKAVLGRNRLVGRVSNRLSEFPVIEIILDQPVGVDKSEVLLYYTLWVESGWTITVLEA